MRELIWTINSVDRDSSGTSSVGSIDLGNARLKDIKEAELLSASYFNTIYNVRSGSNVLNWTDNGAVARTVTVTPGNYTITTLVAALNTGMQAIDGTNLVSYSTATGKVTIASGTNITLTFGTNSSTSIAKLIGFTLSNTSAGTSHVGTNVISLSGPEFIYLVIQEFERAMESSSQTEDWSSFILPLSGSFGELNTWTKETQFRQSLSFSAPRSFSRLRYTMVLPGGTVADLNGSEWRLVVRLRL